MPRPAARSGVRRWLRRISAILPLAAASVCGFAQDISVVRLPRDSDMTVRLENLATHESYLRTGDSYFIVPVGRYSVQLLREAQVVYQEVEFIGPGAPDTRTVDTGANTIVVGLPDGNPSFDTTLCSALETASRLAVSRFGLPGAAVAQRLKNADIAADGAACDTPASVEARAKVLAGSYGATPLGMVGLSIDLLPLSPQIPTRRSTSSTVDPDARGGQRVGSGLVEDLKQGMSDTVVDGTGRPLIVCAATDASTPLLCGADSAVVGIPASVHLHDLYRFHVKTTPVDSRGVEDDHWSTFVGEGEYQAVQQKLVADIEAIRINLLQGIEQVETNSSAPSAGRVREYSAAALTSLIETTQTQIDQALKDNTLQPLRRHFATRIATVAASGTAVTEPDAQRVFRQLQDAVTILANTSGGLGIDLIFRTAPVETEGTTLTFAACDRCVPIISQGGEHRFYRGRYFVTATRDGYAAYEGWLDLVDDPKTILECDMVRVRRAASGRASTCSLKAQ